MCGIAGWYGSEKRQDDVALLNRMLSSLIHRGPDDQGEYFAGPVALGNRRLSIIDVQHGHQPIANEDGTIWVVLNGEIYNFKELRHELQSKGHIFSTNADTEVIVHGYEEWGEACISRLNGIFGLAIWDSLCRCLLLARDHFGVKPLYYHDNGRRLTFASEIKALLEDSEIPRRVDLEALDLYLTFRFVPAPRTMFADIRKLAPGHLLIRNDRGCLVRRYFDPRPSIDDRLDESDWTALLQERLETAVRRQMMSDVPIGALLSGGIDSGAVVAIMSRLTSQQVRTFTVGFAGHDEVNELDEARRTAAIFNTRHDDILLTTVDYQELLRKAIWHLDEPIATTSALAMYSVCKLAREQVTVVLTGQGADEPFTAYPRHLGERYGGWYRRFSTPVTEPMIRHLVESLPRCERLKRAVRSLAIEDVTERFAQVYAVFSGPMRGALWQPGVVAHCDSELAHAVIDYWRRGVAHLDPLVQMAFIDTRLSLSDDLLTYGDKMSMAASIEARVPFLDLEYMQAVESLPPSMRIRGRVQKYIHKRAVAKWLPADVIHRRKRGFETPVDRWFRSELSGFVRDVLLAPDSACRMFFRPQAITALLDDHCRGREDNRRQLFSLLVFELWHRLFISEKLTRPSKTPDPHGNWHPHALSGEML